ncbi:MAG: YdcP family protein [Ruminococcus sp.]|nr:YdcP family protein [Ruminococcus sp.]
MSDYKKFVPDVEKMFGKLTFAGASKETSRRVNGRVKILEREYNLFSSKLLSENVEVRIPGVAGVKTFEYEGEVRLVNPYLVAEGYAIENRGYVNYVLLADDILKA